ncbi:MAG: tetraacyldisaccharide 4'-kinase, partial [Bacteroidota bacterium]
VVFFSGVRYAEPKPVFAETALKEKVIAFSGIARPQPFQQYVQQHFLTEECITFADHHRYTEKDIENLQRRTSENTCFMTTEKDMVKMINGSLTEQWQQLPLFYIPIQTCFISDDAAFLTWLHQSISSATQS